MVVFGRGYGADVETNDETRRAFGTSELPIRNQYKAWLGLDEHRRVHDMNDPTIGSGSPQVGAVDLRGVEAFLVQEAELLDDRRFEEWEGLFDEDGYYWVPARPDDENPYDELSIFFDDKPLMRTRIARLRHPRII